MKKTKRKKKLYELVRRPTAPPTKQFKNKKRAQKADQTGRKRKHKNFDQK